MRQFIAVCLLIVGMFLLTAPAFSAAPAAPTGVTISGPSTATLATIIWAQNSEADLAGYKVYRSTTSGAYGVAIKIISIASAAAAHAEMTRYMASLPVAATYYFTISAYNSSAEESAKSSEVSVTLTGLSRTAVGWEFTRTEIGDRIEEEVGNEYILDEHDNGPRRRRN